MEYTFHSNGSASVVAAFTAPMSLSLLPFEYGPLFTCSGWYHHSLVRVGGRWRSSALREEIAFNQVTVHAALLALGLVLAARAAWRAALGGRKRKAE